MLNKYVPFFIVIIFIALGCTSSFPVTFHGVSFKDYIHGKRNLDSGYVPANRPVQNSWQLVAFDDLRNDHMYGYELRELKLILNLTNRQYAPEYWKFNYPLYCDGKGVVNRFIASYNFDYAGNIAFTNFSPIQSPYLRGIQAIEEWYFDALKTAESFSVKLNEYGRPYTLYIYHKKGVLIFIPLIMHSRPYYAKQYYQ